MKKRNIALMTDFGYKDGFVGTMKGVILSINPGVCLIDLTHTISPHNTLEASIVLRTSYHFFPKGTIFLVVIDPGVGSNRRSILVETEKYFFIGPDNGALSFALENEKIKKIVELTNKDYFLQDVSNTFHGRDIFAPVAAQLSKGVSVRKFGEPTTEYKKFTILSPRIHRHGVSGKVIYTDHFGNLVTNISGGMVQKLSLRKMVIKIKDYKIEKLSSSYADSTAGQILGIVGSNDGLEIAVNQGNASQIMKAKEGTEIEITVG
ncbi:MAG: SAM-dependent chlorinase/fluorinase [bacterium]|nr:SAM-dependent chlorinase/fluorinase [bacterium]